MDDFAGCVCIFFILWSSYVEGAENVVAERESADKPECESIFSLNTRTC